MGSANKGQSLFADLFTVLSVARYGPFRNAAHCGSLSGEPRDLDTIPCVANLATYARRPMRRLGVQFEIDRFAP